jgi:hypothetical protein
VGEGADRCIRSGRVGAVVLRDALLILYCAGVGFVAAGLAASLYQMITHEPPRFRLLGEGWTALVTTFLFCALTGPAIILDLLLKIRREKAAVGTLAAGVAVAAIWSVCSGILVLHIVLSVRSGLA